MRLVAVVTLTFALALAGCSSGDPAPANQPARSKRHKTFKDDLASNQQAGKPLAREDEARFVAPDGTERRLSDWRGRALVLVFTRGFPGFICPYCTSYTAQLAERYAEIQAQGADVLLVYPAKADDQATKARFEKAVADLLAEDGAGALPFPVFLDPGLQAVQTFNLTGDLSKPSTFVLDKHGALAYGYVGTSPDERPSVERIVKELQALQGAQ
jgi:peroxiredoxin